MIISYPQSWLAPALGGMLLGVSVQAQTPPPAAASPAAGGELQLQMVPGLWLSGEPGTYLIEYTGEVPVAWQALTTVKLTNSPYFFADGTATNRDQRLYRAVRQYDAIIQLPAGSFQMGDSLDEGSPEERPVHTVTLSPFLIDRTEVTWALWREVSEWAVAHGYELSGNAAGKADNHPVHSVSWYDAVKWCNARSEKEGRTPAYYTSADQTAANVYRQGAPVLQNDWVNWTAGYRLPTEAEWEYAARGGAAGQRFPWGDTIAHSRANYDSSGAYSYDVSPTPGPHPTYATGNKPYTSPAASFAPNGYGLVDVAGNVWEWCWDLYGAYGSDAQTDPRGVTSGSSYRAMRGGSWLSPAVGCRASTRRGDVPGLWNHGYGFRTVLPASP